MIRSAMNDIKGMTEERWNNIFKKVPLQGKTNSSENDGLSGESQGSPVSIADENLVHKEEDKDATTNL